jgi:hypothetical protein
VGAAGSFDRQSLAGKRLFATKDAKDTKEKSYGYETAARVQIVKDTKGKK